MSFPAYPEYKDSGVEWLGEVPEHWSVSALKRVARLESGDAISSDHISEEGEYAVYGGNGIRGFSSGYTHDGFCPLIGRQGALCGNINYASGKFWASEHAVVVWPENQIDAFWLGELLRSMNLNQYATSAAQPGLSVDAIENLYVPVPPDKEQQKIAEFLDHETARIDALVEEQQRLIELLKEKRQAVISHAVTKGLDPDVTMKDSGVEWLGEVPAHWTVTPLAYAAFFQEGPGILASDFREKGVPLLRVSGVQSRWASLNGCNYLDPEDVRGKWDRFRLSEGDLVISASASMGVVSEVGADVEGAIPYTGIIRFRPVHGKSCKDFIRAFLGSNHFFDQVNILKAGSTIQHFGPTHLGQMKIVLPPVVEQENIADHVEHLSARYSELMYEAERGVSLLKERRSALISAAVTGKIDVRDWTPPDFSTEPEHEHEGAAP